MSPSPSAHLSPSDRLSHCLTLSVPLCYDETKGIQDLKICSHADSLPLSPPVSLLLPLTPGDTIRCSECLRRCDDIVDQVCWVRAIRGDPLAGREAIRRRCSRHFRIPCRGAFALVSHSHSLVLNLCRILCMILSLTRFVMCRANQVAEDASALLEGSVTHMTGECRRLRLCLSHLLSVSLCAYTPYHLYLLL